MEWAAEQHETMSRGKVASNIGVGNLVNEELIRAALPHQASGQRGRRQKDDPNCQE